VPQRARTIPVFAISTCGTVHWTFDTLHRIVVKVWRPAAAPALGRPLPLVAGREPVLDGRLISGEAIAEPAKDPTGLVSAASMVTGVPLGRTHHGIDPVIAVQPLP
jgi:hypothetical protein